MRHHPFNNHFLTWFFLTLLLAAGILMVSTAGSWAQEGEPSDLILGNPVVSAPVTPIDTTGLPPAPTIIPKAITTPIIRELRPLPRRKSSMATAFSAARIASVQTWQGPVAMPAPLASWDGIAHTGMLPPDTAGQVGPHHYVQIVNHPRGALVRVWDKDGTQRYNFGLQDLWPANDTCHEEAYGDPVVLYDQMADRWILTQFTDATAPYYECIALSKTGTPTNVPGDWHLYSFKVHDTKFNDYPKLGVWPDGYYMSVNQFSNGNNWAGAGVFVFDRNAMLDGNAATFQYFDLENVNSNYGCLLPSNLMGSALPPASAPNYFMSVNMNWNGSDDILHIWEFHTDWTTPANSTFTLAKDLVVDPFDMSIGGIPQPDTNQKLDTLSDCLMMHLWYRNYGNHESFVVAHTIDVGNDHAGIRWYEIRGGAVNTTLTDAIIYQQGAYAPDAVHRWMGSAAMDHTGNLAVGYSVSSSTIYPGIRYAGRLADAPLGQLSQGEGVIIDGSGSQTHSADRWGDYSSLSVDPADDCTFWYTTEYMETTSSANWQTRIASFKFDNCCGGSLSDVEGLSNSKSGHDVVITWTNTVDATAYKIYRSVDPYFTPNDATNYLDAVTTAPYTDTNALGDANINYTYKVLGADSCPPASSDYIKRVGEFDFVLIPGSN